MLLRRLRIHRDRRLQNPRHHRRLAPQIRAPPPAKPSADTTRTSLRPAQTASASPHRYIRPPRNSNSVVCPSAAETTQSERRLRLAAGQLHSPPPYRPPQSPAAPARGSRIFPPRPGNLLLNQPDHRLCPADAVSGIARAHPRQRKHHCNRRKLAAHIAPVEKKLPQHADRRTGSRTPCRSSSSAATAAERSAHPAPC